MIEKKKLSAEEKAIERQKKKREREISDIRALLLIPEGRRFFWRLLSRCQLFTENEYTETNQAFIDKGKRLIGNGFFYDLLEASPTAFSQMSRENDSEIQSEKAMEELDRKQDPSVLTE